MELASINTPAAAFVAGLVTSLHCAGMCGPLACMFTPTRDYEADPQTVATVYHVARISGYATLGGLAGAVGQVPLALLGGMPAQVIPWVLVVFFIIVGFRLEKRLPRLAFVARLQGRLQMMLRGRSRLRVAAAMGVATPILPCGPLYFLVTLAALSGSTLRGIEFMLAFGLGTVPLLWLVQSNYGLVRARLSPLWLARFQSGLALVVAVVITWRLRSSLGFAGPAVDSFCCH